MHTSKNCWKSGFDNELRVHNAHDHDTNTSLGCSVAGTEVGEDKRGGSSHESEEGGPLGANFANNNAHDEIFC